MAKVAPLPVRSATASLKAIAPMDREAVNKLMEENARLKHEKAVLEQHLGRMKMTWDHFLNCLAVYFCVV